MKVLSWRSLIIANLVLILTGGCQTMPELATVVETQKILTEPANIPTQSISTQNPTPWPTIAPPVPYTYFLGFNTARAPFDDPLVRRAFAAAIDRQALVDFAGLEGMLPATTMVPPQVWPDGRSLYRQIGLFPQDGQPQDEVPWQVPPVVRIYVSEPAQAIAQQLQKQLRDRLDVEIELVAFDVETYLQHLDHESPQAFIMGWIADYNSPYNFLADFVHDQSRWLNWSDASYDQLLEDALHEIDLERSQEMYLQAEQILCQEEAVVVPLFHYAYEPPAQATPTSASASEDPPSSASLSFELLGRPAAYRELGYHAGLWDLQRWHGRIYLAHGDWYTNSGPLRMLYYDVESEEFIHEDGFMLDEHGMEVIRLFGDTLLIPGTETTGREYAGGVELSSVYIRSGDQPWARMHTIPGAVHIWDATFLEDLLVAIGQKGEIGGIWISSDSGQTWQERPDFQAEGYTIPLSGFVLGDNLYVTTAGTGCLVFDGHSWEQSDCLAANIFEGTTAVQKNAVFQDVITMAPYWVTLDQRVHFFDGKARWAVEFPQPVHDVVASEEMLFVLTGDPSGRGEIYMASRLDCQCAEDFIRIVELDFQDETIITEEDPFMRLTLGSTPHSLEFAAGRFYVGLADGRLFRSTPYQP